MLYYFDFLLRHPLFQLNGLIWGNRNTTCGECNAPKLIFALLQSPYSVEKSYYDIVAQTFFFFVLHSFYLGFNGSWLLQTCKAHVLSILSNIFVPWKLGYFCLSLSLSWNILSKIESKIHIQYSWLFQTTLSTATRSINRLGSPNWISLPNVAVHL